SYGLLKPGVADPITFNGAPAQVPILYQLEDALGPYGDTARGELSAKTVGLILNIVITIPIMVLPFLSTGHPRRPQESPFLAAFGVAGIVYVFNVSVYSANNVIFTKIGWWGDSLLKLTPFVGVAGKASVAVKAATWASVLGGLAFWVLPLPILSFLMRRYVLGESVKRAATVTILSLVILVTIIGYAAGLDLVKLLPFHIWGPADNVGDPLTFWATALNNTSMLAWIVWWSTLLSFELAFWALVKWKQHGAREEHYEHDLNLTYYKVR
ncbi:MAG: hypothetical protein LC624_06690, partial [Halobacteriales archaeon]|nr:hypothetical protein [Halobacteriales archaeon]